MLRCPWFVTPSAVRRYMAFTRAIDFDAAQKTLLKICAETWERYRGEQRQPKTTGTGAHAYRMGHKHGRYWIVVAHSPRPEGPMCPVVDIGAAHEGQRPQTPWRVWRARQHAEKQRVP